MPSLRIRDAHTIITDDNLGDALGCLSSYKCDAEQKKSFAPGMHVCLRKFLEPGQPLDDAALTAAGLDPALCTASAGAFAAAFPMTTGEDGSEVNESLAAIVKVGDLGVGATIAQDCHCALPGKTCAKCDEEDDEGEEADQEEDQEAD